MFKLARGLSLSPFHREWLAKDIVAGVVLTTLLVPQGMAYAELAGLPAITGLYTSIMCLLGYAVFGRSRILVLGPDSSLGPMIAATILPLIAANGDAKRAVALASLLAIMVAVIMIVAGVAKLGFIADLISKPTMIGYLNGLALTILVGQLPKLFGFKVDAEGLIGEFIVFVKGLANGEAVAAAAAVGIAGIFQGFPVSTSGSRTAVAERAGAKTQLTGVVGAALIILMIVLVPGLFRNLPQPALAAVVITASLSLADIPGTVRLWRQRRVECLLSIAAFLSVALLGVLPGIAIAVGLSILNVFRRAWWPYDTVLGRVEGLAGSHDIHSYPAARLLAGLGMYR